MEKSSNILFSSTRIKLLQTILPHPRPHTLPKYRIIVNKEKISSISSSFRVGLVPPSNSHKIIMFVIFYFARESYKQFSFEFRLYRFTSSSSLTRVWKIVKGKLLVENSIGKILLQLCEREFPVLFVLPNCSCLKKTGSRVKSETEKNCGKK